jgi:mono/diheme cytochrome c family protein
LQSVQSNKRTIWLVAAMLLMVVLAAGCKPGDPARSTGAYPIDIFQEMHYNQTHKAQEPPRLHPPVDSVPVAGGFIAAPSKAQAKDLPLPAGTSVDRGALLFVQNCAMCHGLTGEGNGTIADKFREYNVAVLPPSFSDPRVTSLTPGEAFASISGGFGGLMPAFQSLVTEDDRWALAALVKADAGMRVAALEAINGLHECERTLKLLRLRGQPTSDQRVSCPPE